MNAFIEISNVLICIVNLLINWRLWLIILSNIPFIWYIALCKTLSNVFVLKHDCKVIQAQRTIPSDIKYYHQNPPINHSHGDILLGIHSFNESFEDYYYKRYDSLMSVSHGLPSPTPLLSTSFFNGILQRQMKFDIIALDTLYFHLHLYFLDAFFNARMELKIYHLIILIIIMIDLSFSVFYLLFICFF